MIGRAGPALAFAFAFAFALGLLLASCTWGTGAAGPSARDAETTGAARAAHGLAVPSAGCASRGRVHAGVSHRHLDLGGDVRTYRRFVPADHRPGAAAPLVVDLHGLTMSDDLEAALTGFEGLAAHHGFVVVTPQGRGAVPYWNVGAAGGRGTDIAFISALVDRVDHDLCIDTSRVYATGISNGGLLASALACGRPDIFAAVAPVSGVGFPPGCGRGPAVPYQAIYGTADDVLPYDGGLGRGLQGYLRTTQLDRSVPIAGQQRRTIGVTRFPPVDESMSRWAAKDGCARRSVEHRISDDVVRRTWPGCAGGTEVRLYVVDGGGHTWPGTDLGGRRSHEVVAGDLGSATNLTTQDISATHLAWSFFLRHRLER